MHYNKWSNGIPTSITSGPLKGRVGVDAVPSNDSDSRTFLQQAAFSRINAYSWLCAFAILDDEDNTLSSASTFRNFWIRHWLWLSLTFRLEQFICRGKSGISLTQKGGAWPNACSFEPPNPNLARPFLVDCYDKTWTSRVSSFNWKHFCLGVSQPLRIVTAFLRHRNTLTYLRLWRTQLTVGRCQPVNAICGGWCSK